ncbi:MAG TPA: cytochrome c [Sphingomicrobium sp.]|nr:cytochrome c [Sphingomicrobium sp.]
MAKVWRWTGYVIIVVLGLMAVGAAILWLLSWEKLNRHIEGRPEHLVAPTAAELADGPRQLRVLACMDCHGQGLRGQIAIDDPSLARLYAPNLTLVAASATDQQLARAIRQGIEVDGKPLALMPSAQYARLDDRQVAALIAAIRALPRGGRPTPPVRLGPVGIVGVALGQFPTAHQLVEEDSPHLPMDVAPQFERGRALVMVNCAECHGPALEGLELEPGLKAPDLAIAAGYDLPQFTRLMRTGIAAGNRNLPVMSHRARAAFSHYTDDEIASIHAYLVARAAHQR